jgi:glycosyltransferase involved in cell wall biosynthesis
VVIPCLNEEANVLGIYTAVRFELEKAAESFEILFIDNNSTDRTVEILRSLCAADKRVRAIFNNRDYGQMRSPTYGIYQASGRAVIGMCADFQDSPDLIPTFIARWRAGAKIVLAIRQSDESPFVVRVARNACYAFVHRFADYPVIPGATGFGLYDRAVVETIATWREPEPFFRGMLVESGFPLETIPYVRPPRAGGESNNTVATSIDFVLSGLAGSSKRLLRLPIYFGVLSSVGAMGLFVGAFVTTGPDMWGWLLTGFLTLNLAALLVFLGLLGEQVRAIAERTRNAPLVIEKERVNFSVPPSRRAAIGLGQRVAEP